MRVLNQTWCIESRFFNKQAVGHDFNGIKKIMVSSDITEWFLILEKFTQNSWKYEDFPC